MREITHREYLTWMERFEQEWNEPDRHDYYLMQVAYEARYANPFRKAKQFATKHWKLIFGDNKPKTRKMTVEEATAVSRARWFGLTGYKRKKD